MEFGLNFFPDVAPEEKSAQQYWNECLYLASLADELGFINIRTVEHHFHRYGGYSPNPVVFLAAAAQRTAKARLVTGAILPVFNHPIGVAEEIGMLDAISNGRLDVGFGRAFLPHEFFRFGIPMDESRARFDEGVEQIRRLLEEENVTMEGRFHSFKDVTSFPRPTQKPRPPFAIATSQTPESLIGAAQKGYPIMMFPITLERLKAALKIYRDAWREAGHPGRGYVTLAFHMFCSNSREHAEQMSRNRVDAYFGSMADATAEWHDVESKDYPNYKGLIERLQKAGYDTVQKAGTCWVGTPADIVEKIKYYDEASGGFECASLQVNFHTMPVEEAEASMRLFSSEVMPHFASPALVGTS